MATLTPNPLEWDFRNALWRAIVSVEQPPVTDGGFTPIVLSQNNTAYYVSNSGSDSNPGTLAQPFLTTRHPLENVMVGGDHLLLDETSDFQGNDNNMANVPSGQVCNPTVITTYSIGIGNRRARVRPFGWQRTEVKAHVLVSGLHFYVPEGRFGDPLFDSTVHPKVALLSAEHNNIIFEDNYFENTELTLDASPEFSNITIRRNIFDGAYKAKDPNDIKQEPRSNMFLAKVRGALIEDNVIDHGGWTELIPYGFADQYNHNCYFQYNNRGKNFIVRSNIVTRGSSHGVQMRSGGIADNNFFGRNANSLLFGSDLGVSGIDNDAYAVAINNVMSEGHSMVKGTNIDEGFYLMTASVEALRFEKSTDVPYISEQNILSKTAPGAVDSEWFLPGRYNSLGRGAFREEASDPFPGVNYPVVRNGDVAYKWDNDTQGTELGLPDPERDLGSYYALLLSQGKVTGSEAGRDNFEKFLNSDKVRGRQRGEWDLDFTANSINNYIRAGYNVAGNATFNA